jgi:hypothetical protein
MSSRGSEGREESLPARVGLQPSDELHSEEGAGVLSGADGSGGRGAGQVRLQPVKDWGLAPQVPVPLEVTFKVCAQSVY